MNLKEINYGIETVKRTRGNEFNNRNNHPIRAGIVIGTLKRGYWNHQRFCAQARSIEPAVVWGRLYHLHAGFPP